MDFKLKQVTQVPTAKLWDEVGYLDYNQISLLDDSEVKEYLNIPSIKFVIADLGRELNWIQSNQFHKYWKQDIKDAIWDGVSPLDLDKFRNGYAYKASKWQAANSNIIILFEKYH